MSVPSLPRLVCFDRFPARAYSGFVHDLQLYVFLEINNSIKADEKVVMTYVSSYYHAFSTTQKVICCMQAKRLSFSLVDFDSLIVILFVLLRRPSKQRVASAKY